MKNIIPLQMALPLLAFFLVTPPAFCGDINYRNFTSPTGLIFQGDATLQGSFVRLTPSHTNLIGRVGGLWIQTQQSVRQGFESTFRFRITDKVRNGGEGFAFVLQGRATPSLGASGYHLGFVRGGSAFAVKFDTYHWHRNKYVRYDEIAVTTCGGELNPEDLHDPLGTVTTPELYSDGKLHTARVRYVPGQLQVFLDDLAKPLLTVAVKLEDFVSFENGVAWVGFTSSTGADSQNHDIVSWTFNKPYDVASPSPVLVSIPVERPLLTVINTEQDSVPPKINKEIIGLPLVDAEGKLGQPRISIPSSVDLTHRVYASTDLVSWTEVTNLSFYFADPDARDYDRRFYRFSER